MKLKNLFNIFFVIACIFSGVIIAHDELHRAHNNLEGFTHIECELRPKMRSSRSKKYDKFKLTDKRGSTYESFTHPHIEAKQGTSQNWGGYIAITNINSPAHNSVDAVYGSWVVPSVKSSTTHDTWCSLWVGIDGYSNGTVEQIGTEHDWYKGKQVDYAWFEMYPDYSYEIVGFPLKRGDLISASVVYKCDGVFIMTIVNETKKVYATIPASYTTSLVAQRSSAEWVAEAPYLRGIILPLSHFGTVKFSNCLATINDIHGSIKDGFWMNDMLTMVGNGGTKAIPSPLSSDGRSFSVTWKHE